MFLSIRAAWACTCIVKRTLSSFPVIKSQLDINSSRFHDNVARTRGVALEIQTAIESARAGGGTRALERHVKANKKLFVRDRLKLLLDPNAPFLELSQLAGHEMPYGDVKGAGLITGIGQIEGRMCFINANDATVKAGSMFPVSVKKQLRGQEIALQNQLPVVNLVDSGGAFLPLQAEIFPDSEHGGKTFANLATLSSKGIPVVTIVCGSCTAGAAYIPTMSQEAIIVKSIGSLYLGGPPLVKASTGEEVSSEDLGGADVHCSISGCTDHYATNEEEALAITRNIVATFGEDKSPFSHADSDPPCYSADELLGLAHYPGSSSKYPALEVIARIVDGSKFQEFKPKYGPELITGYAKLYGQVVGVIANNGEMAPDAASKGSQFVQICNSRGIPLIFLCDVVDRCYSCNEDTISSDVHKSGLAIKAQAQMIHTVSLAQVPRITIVVGDSFGPTSFAMCSRSLSPNFLFLWPNARIGAVRPEEVQSSSEDDGLCKLNQQCSSLHATSRVWDDGIILPQQTRQVLHLSLTAAQYPYRPMGNTGMTRTRAVMRM
ncbi:methylcrotonoyl-CoA carboxylase beta chain, mitochondrial-like [Corticium candelabrum]|uniref:methylcrotonoyl-CoA carboxylase beta chain, mitochondrial-like n=1 Tax=Corticium candelabrum TaxID=121492 RepID=UPI002E26EA31|nr:methylcrotonoyl-CoA carboxylase beta chain, mitochondrial-like [Corticium candelabrum]